VAVTGQWWLDARKPKLEDVAAHLVNLAWNGLSNLDPAPRISASVASAGRNLRTVPPGSGRYTRLATTNTRRNGSTVP
jgi:hypothetical protein